MEVIDQLHFPAALPPVPPIVYKTRCAPEPVWTRWKEKNYHSLSGIEPRSSMRPGREADHSLPSSAEVKNAWSYTSTPPIHLHGVVLS